MVKENEIRAERFDAARIAEIADMAKRHVIAENSGRNAAHTVPNGTFSDFECIVWEIIVNKMREIRA